MAGDKEPSLADALRASLTHDYVPRDGDHGDWSCEVCGFDSRHPWHTGEA